MLWNWLRKTKPTFAICEATVPKVTIHVGRCFGVARLLMGTLRMGIDMAYAWPSAQVSRMDPREAVEMIYEDEIAISEDPEKVRRDRLNDLLTNYVNHPYHALEQAMVNEIIDPRDTRPVLIDTLRDLVKKQPTPRPWRKHSLIPQ